MRSDRLRRVPRPIVLACALGVELGLVIAGHAVAHARTGDALGDALYLRRPSAAASIQRVTGTKAPLRAAKNNGRRAGAASEIPAVFPSQQQTCVGGSVMLTIPVDGESLSYQWVKNGQEIPGATGRTLIFPAVASDDAGDYAAVVTTMKGARMRVSAAHVDVRAMPTIVRQPVDRVVHPGEAVMLEVDAVGEKLSYQWRRDGVDIPGAIGRGLVIPSVSTADAGSYSVVVTAEECIFGGTESRLASLTVIDGAADQVAASANADVGSVVVTATAEIVDEAGIDADASEATRAVRITPNPASGRAVLHLNDAAPGRLTIYDALGQSVLDLAVTPSTEGIVSFDATPLVDGAYFCRFMTDAGSESIGRLIVRH